LDLCSTTTPRCPLKVATTHVITQAKRAAHKRSQHDIFASVRWDLSHATEMGRKRQVALRRLAIMCACATQLQPNAADHSQCPLQNECVSRLHHIRDTIGDVRRQSLEVLRLQRKLDTILEPHLQAI